MGHIANAISLAFAFAVPAWVALAADVFLRGHVASPYLDASSTFQLSAFYALLAAFLASATFAATLVYRRIGSTLPKSALSGFLTLVVAFLTAFILAAHYGAEYQWLKGVVPIASLFGCAFASALLVGSSGLTRRSTGRAGT